LQLIDLNTQYNPTMMAMGFDPYGGKTAGTQAMGPAASMANTWATNAANTGMFNANANNWASGQQWMMNNMPSMQSGNPFMSGAAGAIGGAATGFMVGGPTGAVVGGGLGLGLGLLGSQ
jgi:hypothetical protein